MMRFNDGAVLIISIFMILMIIFGNEIPKAFQEEKIEKEIKKENEETQKKNQK